MAITDKVVISLHREEDRRRRFFRQPEADGFRIFDAIDGRVDETTPHFDIERFTAHYGDRPTPGQEGCAVSHWIVICMFAEERGNDNDLLLISEDDTEFLPGSKRVLNRIVARERSFDVMVLSDGWSLLADPALRAMVMANRQV